MLQDSAAAQGRRVNNKRLRVTRGPGESRDNNFSPREVEFSGLFPLSPSLFYRQQLHHNLLAKPPRDESFPQPQDRPPADAIAFPATSADDLPNPRVNKSCLPKMGTMSQKWRSAGARRRGVQVMGGWEAHQVQRVPWGTMSGGWTRNRLEQILVWDYILQNELNDERWKQRRTPGAADYDGDEPETKGGRRKRPTNKNEKE